MLNIVEQLDLNIPDGRRPGPLLLRVGCATDKTIRLLQYYICNWKSYNFIV